MQAVVTIISGDNQRSFENLFFYQIKVFKRMWKYFDEYNVNLMPVTDPNSTSYFAFAIYIDDKNQVWSHPSMVSFLYYNE